MKLFPALLSLAAVSVAALAGCAADVAEPEIAGDVEIGEDALTSAPSNFGYFIVTRRDARECAAPACGGFFVKRVNEATTACADGTRQEECYVGSIELKGARLSPREEEEALAMIERGQALIKARAYKTKAADGVVGTLKANEVWIGATGSAPEGTFFRVADTGIRCVKAPCPSTAAHTLNANERRTVLGAILDQTAEPASDAALVRAARALGTAEGVLIAGGVLIPKCLPGATCGPKVIASELYLRMTRREGQACSPSRGADCNDGQVCAATTDGCAPFDAPGVCSYRPQMCPQFFQPVCGCDGNTYGNACMASAAGVGVASEGACEAPGALD